MAYEIGDRVESIKVGRRKAFIGTIEGFPPAGYNVRADDDGKLWQRDKDELSPHLAVD